MRMMLGVLLLWSLPHVGAAAVIINEIAWMGSASSANDEWIELLNTGSSQNVDDWTLSDGINLDIELAGTVGAGQFAVLERTDDASAPGSAFLIYAGALANTGATLTLRDAAGTIVDQVAGGEDWENIGGDNNTKDTAQLTTSGWVTAVATPGAQNTNQSTVTETDTTDSTDSDPEETDQESGQSNSSGSSNSDITLVLPDVTLALRTTLPKQVYVHQSVPMEVTGYGIGSHLINTLTYNWNFGDGTTGVGRSTEHAYTYPGTYVVYVTAGYARQQAATRHTITVLPRNFSITRNQDGDVQIHNDAKYEVDLSGYVLQGRSGFTVPPHTILLPNATLTIPAEQVEAKVSPVVALIDTESTLVAAEQRQAVLPAGSVDTAPVLAHMEPPAPMAPLLPATAEPPAPHLTAASSATAAALPTPAVLGTSTFLTTAARPVTASNNLIAYLGLLGLLIVGVATVTISRMRSQTTV